MSAAIQIRQPQLGGPRPMPSSRRASAPAEASFLSELIASAEKHSAATEHPCAVAAPARRGYPLPLGAELLLRAWKWLQRSRSFSAAKQLRVSDTVSLGEKRFVAVVHVEGRRFLIGGGASGVSLLTPLDTAADCPDVLRNAARTGSIS